MDDIQYMRYESYGGYPSRHAGYIERNFGQYYLQAGGKISKQRLLQALHDAYKHYVPLFGRSQLVSLKNLLALGSSYGRRGLAKNKKGKSQREYLNLEELPRLMALVKSSAKTYFSLTDIIKLSQETPSRAGGYLSLGVRIGSGGHENEWGDIFSLLGDEIKLVYQLPDSVSGVDEPALKFTLRLTKAEIEKLGSPALHVEGVINSIRCQRYVGEAEKFDVFNNYVSESAWGKFIIPPVPLSAGPLTRVPLAFVGGTGKAQPVTQQVLNLVRMMGPYNIFHFDQPTKVFGPLSLRRRQFFSRYSWQLPILADNIAEIEAFFGAERGAFVRNLVFYQHPPVSAAPTVAAFCFLANRDTVFFRVSGDNSFLKEVNIPKLKMRARHEACHVLDGLYDLFDFRGKRASLLVDVWESLGQSQDQFLIKLYSRFVKYLSPTTLPEGGCDPAELVPGLVESLLCKDLTAGLASKDGEFAIQYIKFLQALQQDLIAKNVANNAPIMQTLSSINLPGLTLLPRSYQSS